VIPVVFLTIRAFGGSPGSAAFGGIFALLEPSLISVGRCMDVGGLVQLFGALSLLFSGLSHHFIANSQPQLALILLQGFFASCAFTSSFNGVVFVLFSIFWPLWRFKSKFQCLLNISVTLEVFFLTALWHIISARRVFDDSVPMSSAFLNFSKVHSEETHLSIWHLVSAAELAVIRLVRCLHRSITNVNPLKIFRRMFLVDEWRILWTRNGRHSLCFTNRYFSVPTTLLAYYHLFWRRFTLDLKSILCLLLISSLIVSAVVRKESCVSNIYTVMVIACVVMPIVLEGKVSERKAAILLTLTLSLSLLAFLDWAPLVYAYKNPNPFISPHIALDLLSKKSV
jgi:hypothetical protein